MDGYIVWSFDMLYQSINYFGNAILDIMGEFGFVVVLGSVLSFVIYRLVIKPLTGYGVGSDTARPKKDKEGE